MKKSIILLILFFIAFGQLCYADNEWISYKNYNKISLDNKIISQADITFVGLFINQENRIKSFQLLNTPLKLSDTLNDFNINCINHKLSLEKEKININSLIISGKIKLSPTKSASKHWLYIEIPELTSTINYSKESNNINNSFSGTSSSDAYKKSNFLFTTGIAPKELMPYADRLMQRTFDLTYKENNKEENFSLTLFAALNSVKYNDETTWSLGDIPYASETTSEVVVPNKIPEVVTENKDSEEKSPLTSATVTSTPKQTKTEIQTETKSEEKSEEKSETSKNPMNLYLIAGVIIIAACIWIAVRIKNSSEDENPVITQENIKNKSEETIKTQNIKKEENPKTETIPVEEEKPVEEIKSIETTVKKEITTEPQQPSCSANEPTVSKVNFCPNCGEKIFEGATFCATCGTKIE